MSISWTHVGLTEVSIPFIGIEDEVGTIVCHSSKAIVDKMASQVGIRGVSLAMHWVVWSVPIGLCPITMASKHQ